MLRVCGKRNDYSLTTKGKRPQEGWGRRQTENGAGGTQCSLWKGKRRRGRRMRIEEEEEGERGEDDSAVENSEALAGMERRRGSDARRSSLSGS